MSGQATGWVLRYGPHPKMLDRNGRPYGNRARGMRAVMVAVADAANRDGQHAHPGIVGICDASLYSRGQVGKILGELVDEGWLAVEEEGGGRGRATVYSIPRMSDETAHSPARSDDANRAVSDEKPRTPDTETAHSEPVNRAPQECAPTVGNGTSNGEDQRGAAAPLPGLPDSPRPDPVDQRARQIVDAVWERKNPKPATPYIGCVKIAKTLLVAGHDPQAIGRAMVAVPTISTRWVEAEIARHTPSRESGMIDDRTVESGRIEL